MLLGTTYVDLKIMAKLKITDIASYSNCQAEGLLMVKVR